MQGKGKVFYVYHNMRSFKLGRGYFPGEASKSVPLKVEKSYHQWHEARRCQIFQLGLAKMNRIVSMFNLI